MPRVAFNPLAVYFDRQTFEDVFDPRVERMKHGRQRGKFDFVRDGIAALGKERLDAQEETTQLFALSGLLLLKSIPP